MFRVIWGTIKILCDNFLIILCFSDVLFDEPATFLMSQEFEIIEARRWLIQVIAKPFVCQNVKKKMFDSTQNQRTDDFDWRLIEFLIKKQNENVFFLFRAEQKSWNNFGCKLFQTQWQLPKLHLMLYIKIY